MPAQRRRLLTLADLRALPETRWLVNDVLPERGFIVLFGPPGAGKTFLALDLALCIASGKDWYGRPCLHGPVLYVTPEGTTGLSSRIAAWQTAMQVDDHALQVLVDKGAPQLHQSGDVEELIAIAKDQMPVLPKLVVFDTLARHMVGGEENSAKDVGLVIGNLDRIRESLGDCAVLLVHHSGKFREKQTGSERGSSALRGSADTMVRVEQSDSGLIRVACEKQKENAAFDDLTFKLEQVQVRSPNDAGTTSCVLHPCARPTPQSAPKPKRDTVRETVLQAAGSKVSASSIARATGAARATIYRELEHLKHQRVIESVPGGRRGDFQVVADAAQRMAPEEPSLIEVSKQSHETESSLTLTHPPKGGSERD